MSATLLASTSRACHTCPAARTWTRPSRCYLRCKASYQTEAAMPPPPPPPPPPAGQGTSRRNVLQQFGGLGMAAMVGGVAGFLVGSRVGGDENGNLSPAERADVDELRREMRFRRDYDGHVFVQDDKGRWWEVRLDAKIPGTLLLRDPEDNLFYISYESLQQIDLTDDYVVGSLFGELDWVNTAQRVQARDSDGAMVDVHMDKSSFRDMLTLMS